MITPGTITPGTRTRRRPMASRAMCMGRTAGMITATTRMIMAMLTTITAINMAEAGSLPLLVWLSPGFPVGAFAYSHGLEWAVESGDIHDGASLLTWIGALVRVGSARSDAVLLAAAWRAVVAGDDAQLAAVTEVACALQPSRERHLETTQQGNAFVLAVRAAWPTPAMDRLSACWDGDIAYPAALGVAAAGHGIALRPLLDAFLLAFVSNLVSAAVRLGPVGQTDGQRTIAALMGAIRETAALAEASTLDDLGSATMRSDLASMRHETQYSRLFRS
jgi:urease accessory protein